VSEDRARSRAPWLVVAGLLLLGGAAFWLRGAFISGRDEFHAFCNATRRAEPWAQVQARAQAKGWDFVPQSASGREPKEYLAAVDVYGYRLGCTVVVEQGRVVDTRYGELPAQ
jgi:hypothetical protein